MIIRGSHSDASRIPSDVPIVNAATGADTIGSTPIGTPPGSGLTSSSDGPTSDATSRSGTGHPAATPATSPAADTSTAGRAGRLSRPNTVEIPSQQVSAPIVGNCPVENGTMEPPPDVHQTCRWSGGESLDAAAGSGITVITGHVNYVGQGQGAFARIGDLRVGDLLVTSGPDGSTIHWTVTRVVAYTKTGGIPERIFTQSDAQRRTLRLITCGGTLESDGSYNDNIIVTAVAA